MRCEDKIRTNITLNTFDSQFKIKLIKSDLVDTKYGFFSH